MAPILYGIANCDTVRKSRAWLAEHGCAVAFHDFKRSGLPPDRLDAWLQAIGWEALLNRKGTTWRRLGEADRAAIVDTDSARAALLRAPTLLKRPVIEWHDGTCTVGHVPESWARHLDP